MREVAIKIWWSLIRTVQTGALSLLLLQTETLCRLWVNVFTSGASSKFFFFLLNGKKKPTKSVPSILSTCVLINWWADLGLLFDYQWIKQCSAWIMWNQRNRFRQVPSSRERGGKKYVADVLINPSIDPNAVAGWFNKYTAALSSYHNVNSRPQEKRRWTTIMQAAASHSCLSCRC